MNGFLTKIETLRTKFPSIRGIRITWFGVLLALILGFDFIWNFSLLSQIPPRDGGELFLIRIFWNILDHGFPFAQLGPEGFSIYPRSVLFNYVMAGWMALTGLDIGWLRLVPLGFYYLSAILVYRILGGGLIGLAGLLTMLASNLRIHLTVCKPWTFYEALFLLAILLFKRAYVDRGEDPARLSPDRSKRLLIGILIASALVYESAGLVALLIGMLGLVYLGLGILKERGLTGAVVFNVLWIFVTSYLIWKIPLFDFQIFGGAQGMFSPEKYPQMLNALWNGEFLRGIIPLITFGYFKIVPLGLFFLFLVAVFLVARRNGLGEEYGYYSVALVMMICQVVLYFVLMKDRQWDRVESGRYIFQFHAVWILFIWLTVKTLAEKVKGKWQNAARIGLTVLLGLGVAWTLVGEGRMKPFFEHNYHDFNKPMERLTKELKHQDRIYLVGGYLSFKCRFQDFDDCELVAVGNPPRKGRTWKSSGSDKVPFTDMDYYTDTKIIDGFPWLADLVGAVQGGRKVWIVQNVWPLRERLEDYSPEQFYLAFQKDLYDLTAFPELSRQVRILDSGKEVEFPKVELGGSVLTLEVTNYRDKQTELMTVAGFSDHEPPSRKRIVLNPGLNRIVLFHYRLPQKLTLTRLDNGPPLAQVESATIEGLGTGLRTVLESSLLGRGLNHLVPFKTLRSLAFDLVLGQEGRKALEKDRRYPDKAPDTFLIFKVIPPSATSGVCILPPKDGIDAATLKISEPHLS